MKLKGILLVSVLLVILSIGTVCASDLADNDSLQTIDDASSDIDSSEVLGDGSYFGNDFYVSIQENYTQDKSDWQYRELIYVSSYSQNNATLKVLVDDVEKESLAITDGYFSLEDDGYGGTYNKYYACIYPTDLGLDCGSYNIKVNVGANTLLNSQVTLKEKDDFDIWMQNPYYCEQEYWSSPSFIIIDSNHLNNGTLEILVNGSKKLSYSVTDGSFEAVPDCSNKSRYIAPADLLDGYGKYNVKITFEENGVTKTLKDEIVKVLEFEPTVNPKIDLYFDFYTLTLPADNIARIYLPREATGKLTISYNNVKNETISYSKGQATHYMHSWNLNHLGENTVTVTYIGDDFGTLTATGTVMVLPAITAPSYVSAGEKFTISMLTHDWVLGNFNVYDYSGDVKGDLLGSDEIFKRTGSQFATAAVMLSSEEIGLNRYYLEFDYPGGYYLIWEVNVVENSKNVSVTVPNAARLDSDVCINITAPASPFNFVYVSIDDGPEEYFSMAIGEVSKTVSFSAGGDHKISVKYDGRFWDYDGNYVGDIYSNTFIVKVGYNTNVTSYDVVTDYKCPKNLTVKLQDENGDFLAGEEITIRLNGETYTRTTDENGTAWLSIDLGAGNYTAEICFDGSLGYLASKATANIYVNKIESEFAVGDVNVVYCSSKNLIATLKDDYGVIANKEILIKFNGINSTKTTDAKGQVAFPINVAVGIYSVEFVFAGDGNYNPSNATSKVTVTKAYTKLTAPKVSMVYNTGKYLVATLKDSNNKPLVGKYVSIRLLGKTYTRLTDGNGQIKLAIGLSAKTYTANVYFNGDNNYMKSSTTAKIVVTKATPKLTAPNRSFKVKANTKKVTATLKDNKGKVMKNTKVTLKVNGRSYSAKTNSKGVAAFYIKLTKRGTFKGTVMFAGNNNFKPVTRTVKITVKR